MAGICCDEGGGGVAWEYGFWVGATVLAVLCLGGLKRWLLRLAQNKGAERPDDESSPKQQGSCRAKKFRKE